MPGRADPVAGVRAPNEADYVFADLNAPCATEYEGLRVRFDANDRVTGWRPIVIEDGC